jgi:hypothetical protein
LRAELHDRWRQLAVLIAILAAGAAPLRAQEPSPPPAPAPAPTTQPPEAPPSAPPTADAQPEPAPEVPPDPNPEVAVTMKDGQRFTGLLVERTPDKVVLRIAGIDTPIKAAVIERLEVLPPVVERYKHMRAMINDGDADRLLLIVEWLRARGEYTLALKELDGILAAQPENAEAQRLKLLVDSQKQLADRAGVGRDRPGALPRPAGPVIAAPGVLPGAAFPLLTAKDINLIKVYEVNLADPPRMVIPRDVVTRLIERFKNDPRIPATPEGRDELYRWSPTRILKLMFQLQARDLYSEVQVVDQPRALRLFRDNVHRAYIENYCATARCHGGAQAGRLPLYSKRPNAEETVYTNFLIIDRFRFGDGKPLVDYQEPAASALIQLGMPRDISKRPHPLVPNPPAGGDAWKPFIKSKDDLRYQQIVEWVNAMYHPHPSYPVDYTPPVPEPVAPDPGEKPVER